MRPIVYDVAMTLDGFICHEDGSVGGFLPDGEHATDYLERLKGYNTVLMGRRTYEFGYEYGMKPGDKAYPHMDHYVFSDTLRLEGSEVNVVPRDSIDLVRELKEAGGGVIYLCGGGVFAGRLLEEKLVDRLTIKLNPVLFGRGMPLFGNRSADVAMRMMNHKTYENGVALLEYELQF